MNDIAYAFSVPQRFKDELSYLEEYARRSLGDSLIRLLEDGERFTVKLQKESRLEYYDEVQHRWYLELGEAEYRNITIPIYDEQIYYISKSMPKYELQKTAFLPMFIEVSRRIFNAPGNLLKRSAQQVDKDIRNFS